MGKNKTVRKALGNLDVAVAAIMLIILVSLTFGGVIMRYVVGNPLTWLEEVQLACMVWIVFAAGGAAFRTGSHVAIEILVDTFPDGLQRAMKYFIGAIMVLIIGYLFIQSLGFVGLFLSTGRSTSMLKIPYALIYGIAPVSYIAMLVSYFYTVYAGEEPETAEVMSFE